MATESLSTWLGSLGALIDASLRYGDLERAASLAWQAAGALTHPNTRYSWADLDGALAWGEQYYRWQLWDAGAAFWRAAYDTAARGYPDPGVVERAWVHAGAMALLAGQFPASSPQAVELLARARRSFGADHAVARAVAARVNTLGDPRVDALEFAEKASLWLALATLHIGRADGQVTREELVTYERLFLRLKLPEIRDRFSPALVVDLYVQGLLPKLSEVLSAVPEVTRSAMIAGLFETVMADGQVDPRELAAVQQLAGWCQVSLAAGPAPPLPPQAPAKAPTPPPGTLQRLGFFRELRHGDSEGPSLREAVRATAAPFEPELLEYLADAPIFIASPGRVSDVLDPSRGRAGTGSIKTDGVWAWPDDLGYYVEHYHVEVPAAFCEHARRQQWIPPAERTLDRTRLKLGPAAAQPSPAAGPGDEVWVVLDAVGPSKIAVIKELRDATLCGLLEAKELSEQPQPRFLLTNPKLTPEEVLRRFAAAGARARLERR